MQIRSMAFTGHRPESLPFGENEAAPACVQIKQMMRDEIKVRAAQGCNTFYCGAARGGDIIFGEQVLQLQEDLFPDLRLICVVPHEGQANSWSESWRDRYFALLERSDDEVLISSQYTRDCYLYRNRYMVDHADMLLSLYSGQHRGGTFYTVKYAYHRNKEIVILDPNTLERKLIPPRLQAI